MNYWNKNRLVFSCCTTQPTIMGNKMSTRCMVYIDKGKGNTYRFYKHTDGYPEGVGACIMDVASNKRTPLKIKQCIEGMLGGEFEAEGIVNTEEFNNMFEVQKRIDNTSAFESNHMDIEWRYRIQKDGTLKIDCINTGMTWEIKNQEELVKLIEVFADNGEYK